MLDEGLKRKNRESTNPWKTPIKINTDRASILVVVFIVEKTNAINRKGRKDSTQSAQKDC
jgi:hypothetical protein